jgi:hypothetical protein
MNNEKINFFQGTSFEIGCSHGELIVDRYVDVLTDLYASELWVLTKRKFPDNILDTFKSIYLIICLKSSLKKEKLATEYLKGVLSIKGMSQKKMHTLLLTEV